MFWSGMVVGIFVGAALGILVMALAVSASSSSLSDDAEDRVFLGRNLSFEAGDELVPEERREDEMMDRKMDKKIDEKIK